MGRGQLLYSRSRSCSRIERKPEKWEQAAKATIVTGTIESFRSRKIPSTWTRLKGKQIATTAVGAAGAAGIDGLVIGIPKSTKNDTLLSRLWVEFSRTVQSTVHAPDLVPTATTILQGLGQDQEQGQGQCPVDHDHAVAPVTGMEAPSQRWPVLMPFL